MAKLNRQQRGRDEGSSSASAPYASSGHQSFEQLMAEQGTGPVTDVATLHGNFWPEEETIEEFLATLDEWRGRKPYEPVA